MIIDYSNSFLEGDYFNQVCGGKKSNVNISMTMIDKKVYSIESIDG